MVHFTYSAIVLLKMENLDDSSLVSLHALINKSFQNQPRMVPILWLEKLDTEFIPTPQAVSISRNNSRSLGSQGLAIHQRRNPPISMNKLLGNILLAVKGCFPLNN